MLLLIPLGQAQNGYWQQSADYEMDIDFDVENHQFTGSQTITYTNNSPDTLKNLYYHLYFNAFQPGSMMDTRSINIADADQRVGDRISRLAPHEIGYLHIKTLTVKGSEVQFNEAGTILEVDLEDFILPGETVKLESTFEAQVPLQIRRSGRDSEEGVSYSMTQWYPKLANYDNDGWHPNPYVGREFYGIWGDFDVTIHIDKDYTVAASGVLQNKEEIGHGYAPERKMKQKVKKSKKLSWNFLAENVHDFAWGADEDYTHEIYTTKSGVEMHFFYIPGPETTENWQAMPPILEEALEFMNKHYGKYPYPVYSFIQGGDGGMEYPMATLITGERTMNSLVGVSIHEWMHSWYQMVLAFDEAQYPWMDEGFTSYGSAYTMNHLFEKGLLAGGAVEYPMANSVKGLGRFAMSGLDEPLTTHADHFSTNAAYGVGSYTKGAVYLEQLKYIVGEETFNKALLKFYNTWKFKHPTPNHFIKIMEDESGMILDWYNQYWVNMTKYPDYGIDTVHTDKIVLKQSGEMPMPLEVIVTDMEDQKTVYYIPMRIMRGEKPRSAFEEENVVQLEDWPWTHPTYEIMTNTENIKSISINPNAQYVDLNWEDNSWERVE